MKVEKLVLNGLALLSPKLFSDERGFFTEIFNQRIFNSLVRETTFVQDNHSRSKCGVVRGLHYQLGANAQAKLVRCVSGSIFDVAVDIRRSSPTFGKWFGVELSSENCKMLWIPEGFAHGFCALTESADVLYKTSAYYDPAGDRSINWSDPDLAIDWPLSESPSLSEKDRAAPLFRSAETFP